MTSQDKPFECDKCGQHFESKNELQDRAQLCTGAGQQQGQGKTRQAGGQSRDA